MIQKLLKTLMTTIRGKVIRFVTKLRRWTSRSYIETRIISRLQKFFTEKLSIKPRHKDDYYRIFSWLVSKRLVMAIVMVIGVLSLYYLAVVNPVFQYSSEGTRTYSYNSIPLRFAKGRVRIKAKSGYIAYEGDVEKGYVTGQGTLYNKNEGIVYTGSFAQSKYNGSGKLYYENGLLHYEGEFINNLFDGTGTLYRENGSIEYKGSFSQGMKEGGGELYDTGNNRVYMGNFSKDQLLYSDFLGKSTDETASMYMGERTIYTDENYFVVSMDDIGAIYCGSQDEDRLDDSVMIDGVYVLSNSFFYEGKTYGSVAEIGQVVADLSYEGNSIPLMPEAVAIWKLTGTRESVFEPLELQTENTFSDVIQVEDYDSDYYVYLYSFIKDDLQYTFFCADKYGKFDFYLIEKI